MLVLTRRPGEEIVIGGGIRITLLRVTGNQVRIGVEAPRSVAVHRQEVVERDGGAAARCAAAALAVRS